MSDVSEDMEDAIINHRALAEVERLKAENAALRWCFARSGFKVLDGHFMRDDGVRTTVAVRPVDIEALLNLAIRVAHEDG